MVHAVPNFILQSFTVYNIHLLQYRFNYPGLEALTLSLCIELCTSCWALLTPGKMIPALTSIKSSYLGLLAPDKNYPPAVQNIIKTSYTSLLAS